MLATRQVDATYPWLPLLSQAWQAPSTRGACPPLDRPPDVVALVAGGVAPLAWKRIEKTAAARTRWGRLLHDHYYRSVMEADRLVCFLRFCVGILDSARLEPILVKGWAIARLYSEPALRLFSDID